MSPWRAIWLALRESRDFPVPYLLFRLFVLGWSVHPIFDFGDLIGGVMYRRNEVHIAVRRRPCGLSGVAVWRWLARHQDRYGRLVTKVRASNEKGLAFCLRLGFEKVSTRGVIIFMERV